MKAKARILSALLSICMLISMLTCFVVPASATASKIDALLDLKHTLRFDEDGNFKVLTLSDIHGKGGYNRNRKPSNTVKSTQERAPKSDSENMPLYGIIK